jgi:hypothetical protein
MELYSGLLHLYISGNLPKITIVYKDIDAFSSRRDAASFGDDIVYKKSD